MWLIRSLTLVFAAASMAQAPPAPSTPSAPSAPPAPSTPSTPFKGQTFPAADPASVGLTAESLAALDAAVKGFVDRDETVGAELLVIKNGKTVLHTVHGLKDKETGAPLELNGIYCVRSMTKPVVGTAIQMLIDEGRIGIDDSISNFLPAFDNDQHRTITIRELLEHRSGLPLSSLLSNDVTRLSGIQSVAELAGKAKLEFEPGTDFNYSDDGADTLAAVVEKVSGMRIEQFVQERILSPLGMVDSIPVLTQDDPRLQRVVSLHLGEPKAWVRHWSPGQPPTFRFFLGSQGLYSTVEDYAKFLRMWMRSGETRGKRMLSAEAVQRGLGSRVEMGYPTLFDGLAARYSQLWMVWTKKETPEGELVGFGHGGSDGTGAWVFPKEDLMVLYFTQSRGGTTALTIEHEIQKNLRGGSDAAAPAEPVDTGPYVGIYWDEMRGRYVAIWAKENRLRMELEGRTIADLVPAGADLWKIELQPNVTVKFQREGGAVVSAQLSTPGMGTLPVMPRLEPAADLPSVEDVVAKVKAAHRLDSIHGAIRRSGTIDAGKAAGQGVVTSVVAKDRASQENNPASGRSRVIATPEEVWVQRGGGKFTLLKGAEADQVRFELPTFVFSDWRVRGNQVRVLRRFEEGGAKRLLVRVTPMEAMPISFVVDEASGRVLERRSMLNIPGLGIVGGATTYSDFSEKGGAVLPGHSVLEFATPMLGAVEVKFDTFEEIEAADSLFKPDAPG